MASRKRVAGVIRSLVNVLGACKFSVLESCRKHCLYLFFCLRKEKERSRIRVVQMDILRGFLGIRRMDRFPNAQIREL